MITHFAPIIIPTLCRYNHLKRLLESLSANKYADKTEVYIGLDYPSKESHWDGYRKICSLLESEVYPFKALHVIKRERNYGFGPQGNFYTLRHMIEDKYDRYIVTEDDNEFSPLFLEYININLEKYKERRDVFCVCGYQFKDLNIETDATQLLMPLFNAWGTGYWTDKRKLCDKYTTHEGIKTLIDDKNVRRHFSKKLKLLYLDLLKCYKQQRILGDVIISAYLIHKNMTCVFPVKSLVRNWGWDGSGTNCIGKSNGYSTQNIDNSKVYRCIEASDEESVKATDMQYDNWNRSYSIKAKIYSVIYWIKFRLTGSI